MGAFDNVIQLDRVRCLECGTKYAKPSDGGLVQQNPGCPRCGYVGWIDTVLPDRASAQHSFAEDPRPHPSVHAG
ncbi:MAG TPA: hypothetical protein VMU73_09410 [Gaiellaceae bacterium]|nr:hypothetical protein [Gaiellaceae bacterium]